MCKMAHFGNCDPETADQEYCIFHKPNKSEEEAVEFYQKFLERFKPRVEEIEVNGKKVKRLVFEEPVDARGFVFPEVSSYAIFFGDSVFEKKVNFQNAIFEDNVSFENAVFKSDVSFGSVTFKYDCYFGGSIFFGEADFDSIEFHRDAYFDNSRFFGNAYFSGSLFKKDAYFDDVAFESEVTFAGSTFSGDVYFQRSVFKRKFDFRWAKAERGLYFEDSPNSPYKFYDKLLLDGTQIGIVYLNIPSKWFKLSEAEIQARRVQRLSYEKEGKRDEADRMFVLEMRAKRRARLQNARNKLEQIKARVYNFVEWLLADLPSEYGTNWVRLFLFSLLVIIGNTIPYTIWSRLIDGFPKTSNIVVRFANALYYSLVTFTTLGYGDMRPTGWLKALSALEALTGAVFMALIVAVIARKWMR